MLLCNFALRCVVWCCFLGLVVVWWLVESVGFGGFFLSCVSCFSFVRLRFLCSVRLSVFVLSMIFLSLFLCALFLGIDKRFFDVSEFVSDVVGLFC